MATAKKSANKAKVPVRAATPAKVVKSASQPAANKEPVSRIAKAIAKLSAGIGKLTGRKDNLDAGINGLREQGTATKVAPASVSAPAAVAPKAKTAAKAVTKAAAPTKPVKRAAKK